MTSNRADEVVVTVVSLIAVEEECFDGTSGRLATI